MTLPTVADTRKDRAGSRSYSPCPTCRESHPSATTVLSVLAKPALAPWMAKVEREACFAAFQKVYESGLPSSWPEIFSQIDQALGREKAGQRKAREAAHIGTEAHDLLQHWLRTELGLETGPPPPASDGAHWAFMVAQDWWRSLKLEPVLVEQVVFAHALGVAGTLDVLAKDPTGALFVVDWKTNATAIYAESWLQNVMYQVGVKNMGLGDPVGGIIVRLPKVAFADTEFETASVPQYKALYPVAEAVVTLYSWWKRA